MISFFDMKKVHKEIEEALIEEFTNVLREGDFILGSKLSSFEREFNRQLSNTNEARSGAIGCGSGTDALILSLLAAGVEIDDEVITVANTAIPTVAAICSIKAKPVFVDIELESLLLDIGKISTKITDRTKAIIPVHLFGNMVNIFELKALLNKMGREDIAIIEDVAQAHGSTFCDKQAGGIGDFGAFSFYPTKNLGALGDAGAVFTNDNSNLEKLRMLRNYGQSSRYNAILNNGINSRLDEIQAAFLSIKLPYIEKWKEYKKTMYLNYRSALEGLPIKFVKVDKDCDPNWHLCVIILADKNIRDSLIRYLEERSIGALIHYPTPLHLQSAFKQYAKVGDLPVTENLCDRILSIPLNVTLTNKEQEEIIKSIVQFFEVEKE